LQFVAINVHIRMSTPFHQETDRSLEKSNKTAIKAPRHYVNNRQINWSDHLTHVEIAMNNSANATANSYN